MRESCTYGSMRGAPSNGRPYRNREITTIFGPSCFWFLSHSLPFALFDAAGPLVPGFGEPDMVWASAPCMQR